MVSDEAQHPVPPPVCLLTGGPTFLVQGDLDYEQLQQLELDLRDAATEVGIQLDAGLPISAGDYELFVAISAAWDAAAGPALLAAFASALWRKRPGREVTVAAPKEGDWQRIDAEVGVDGFRLSSEGYTAEETERHLAILAAHQGTLAEAGGRRGGDLSSTLAHLNEGQVDEMRAERDGGKHAR